MFFKFSRASGIPLPLVVYFSCHGTLFHEFWPRCIRGRPARMHLGGVDRCTGPNPCVCQFPQISRFISAWARRRTLTSSSFDESEQHLVRAFVAWKHDEKSSTFIHSSYVSPYHYIGLPCIAKNEQPEHRLIPFRHGRLTCICGWDENANLSMDWGIRLKLELKYLETALIFGRSFKINEWSKVQFCAEWCMALFFLKFSAEFLCLCVPTYQLIGNSSWPLLLAAGDMPIPVGYSKWNMPISYLRPTTPLFHDPIFSSLIMKWKFRRPSTFFKFECLFVSNISVHRSWPDYISQYQANHGDIASQPSLYLARFVIISIALLFLHSCRWQRFQYCKTQIYKIEVHCKTQAGNTFPFISEKAAL